MVFASLGAFAQLGTDVYTLGLDNANNYGGTWNATNEGSGFSDWTFDTGTPNGGFAGRFTGSFSTELDVSGNSFGLFANSGNAASSGAATTFPKTFQEGDSFQIAVGVNFRDGNKGFDLRDSSNGTIINFNVSNDEYNLTGTSGLFSNIYDSNTVITFTFTQNATNVSWTAARTGGRTESESGIIAAITPSTITNIRLYNVSAGTNGDGGSGQRNLFFNSLEFKSLYSINNTSSVTVSTTATVPYLSIETGSSVTVNSGIGLTVSGDLNVSGSLNVSSGSSLIVNGTSTGNITYNRTLATDNWYLISSPVVGQDIDTFAAAEGLAVGSSPITNRGLGDYNNSTPGWEYYQVGATGTGNFISGDARAIKLATAGDIAFTGTMPDTNASIAINSNTNGFNLIGNPYTSYLALNINASAPDDLLEQNSSSLTETTAWLFNQATGSYDEVNSATPAFYLAPGQGFFVSSNGNNTFLFGNAQKSHQNVDSFQKTATTRPEINLIVNNGTDTRDTDIFYIDGTTTGFDNGYDSSIFGGNFSENKLTVYTHEVTNGNGKKLGIQSLPNSDLETMVIPVGIIAEANKEITFSANVANLPAGLKVFLEDRNTNTFTRLDELNSNYKVTLTEATNGIGRFYLHTKSSALSTETVALENVSIYNADKSTLRIVGLSQGKSTIKMFNVLGKQVLNATFNSNGVSEINVSQLSTGVYIVQLENEAGSLNKKIVLE